MDHTPSDIIVVDDNNMLPLGRPTITTALDEHTRCPMGFYAGFEPPSCLAVMRCLKHAILPKTYVPREFPVDEELAGNATACRNSWWSIIRPSSIPVTSSVRACRSATDIQYAKVLVPWYKGKLERFQGTMNHDLMQGNPGTTFSNILERDDYDPSRHAVVMLSTFREMLAQMDHRCVFANAASRHRGHPGASMAKRNERLAASVATECRRAGHRARHDGSARGVSLWH